jgi:drug/metabolite transporter (DMT)-like permease
VIDAQLAGGVAAAALAAVCFNAAVVLYAVESRTVSADHGLRLSLVTRLARRPRWLAAVALDAGGWPFQLVALSLAPLTVVQPTLSIGLLFLLVVGARRLGEHVGRLEVIAAVAVIAGVTGLALAAPPHTDTASASPGALIAVLGGLLVVTAAPYLLPRHLVGARTMILAAGCAFTATALTSKLLTDELADGRWLAALGIAAGTAAVAAGGLLTETSALQRFEATRVSPGVFVVQTVFPVMAAPFLIGEDWGQTPGGGVAIVAALAATCAGGALLSRSRAVAAAQDEGDEPSTSSSVRSAAAGSAASDASGSRGDASADSTARDSAAGVDATSASPNSR